MRFLISLVKARGTAVADPLPLERPSAGTRSGHEGLRTCWACYCGSSRGCVRSSLCPSVE
jgi:hypothetical protein